MNIQESLYVNTAPRVMDFEQRIERIETFCLHEPAKPCFNHQPSHMSTPTRPRAVIHQPNRDPGASLEKILTETLSIRFDNDEDDDFIIDEIYDL